MGWDPDALREAIVDEVAVQLRPFRDQLDRLDKWSKEVYGNGSGRKGYFEKSRDEDLERWTEIKALVRKANDERQEAQIRKRIAEESATKWRRLFRRAKIAAEVLSIPFLAAAYNWLHGHHIF